jgi:hypothetical protein
MLPAIQRVRDQSGSFVLLLFFQSAFLLRSMLGLLPLFSRSLVFFSLITHIRFSLFEYNLYQNVAQNPSSENQVQGIVTAQGRQRSVCWPSSNVFSFAMVADL